MCDAVDAMLSDRPYRPALTVSAVLEQLRQNVGKQFCPAVVNALIESDLIAEYASIMRASRDPGALEVALSVVRKMPPTYPHRGSTIRAFGSERHKQHVS